MSSKESINPLSEVEATTSELLPQQIEVYTEALAAIIVTDFLEVVRNDPHELTPFLKLLQDEQVGSAYLQEISATYLEHDGSRLYDERVAALGVMKLDFAELRREIISRILLLIADKK